MISNSGTPQGKAALTALAASIHIDQLTLQTALESAFDILPTVRDPGLALQISLARLGYRFDSQLFYSVVRIFRRNFSAVFEWNLGLQSQSADSRVRAELQRTLRDSEASNGFLGTSFDPADCWNSPFELPRSSQNVLSVTQWSSFSPFAPSVRSMHHSSMPMALMQTHNVSSKNGYYSQETTFRPPGVHQALPPSRNANPAVPAPKPNNPYDVCIDPDLEDLFGLR